MHAPAAFTARAVEKIWSRDSPEQGPAMTTASGPPMRTPPTSTTERAPRACLLTSLNGCAMVTTSSTPGAAFSASSSARRPLLPTAAMIVRSAPCVMWAWYPSSRIRSATWVISCWVACSDILTIMGVLLFVFDFFLKPAVKVTFEPARFFNYGAKDSGHSRIGEWPSVALLGTLHHLKLALRIANRRSACALKYGKLTGHLRPPV